MFIKVCNQISNSGFSLLILSHLDVTSCYKTIYKRNDSLERPCSVGDAFPVPGRCLALQGSKAGIWKHCERQQGMGSFQLQDISYTPDRVLDTFLTVKKPPLPDKYNDQFYQLLKSLLLLAVIVEYQ